MKDAGNDQGRAKRVDLAHEPPFSLGAMTVKPALREIALAGKAQTVQPRVMQVLVALARSRGEVVSRDDLVASCWDGLAVSEDAINRCIKALRRLAEDGDQFAIETITKVGYRLSERRPAEAPQAEMPSAPPVPSGPEPSVAAPAEVPHAPAGPARGVRRRHLLIAGAAAVGVVILAWLGAKLLPQSDVAAAQPVAVLPFDVLGDSSKIPYFAASLAVEITSVMNDDQVQTVSHEDSIALRGPDRDKAIAKLGPRYLVDGTVEVQGDSLRVVSHFEDAQAHYTLWSENFTRPASEASALQSEAAARTVDAIQVALSTARAAHIDNETLALTLEINNNVRSGDSRLTPKSVELARDVVARAPRFSFGHSLLALSLSNIAHVAPADQVAALRAEARREAETALSLDPKNAQGFFVLAELVPPGHHRELEAILLKGIATATHPLFIVGSLNAVESEHLAAVGRLEDALPYYRQAITFDPLSPGKMSDLALKLALLGRMSEASALMTKLVTQLPDNAYLRNAHFMFAMFYAAPNQALSLLDQPEALPNGLEAGTAAVWRDYLKARLSPNQAAKAKAIAGLTAATESGSIVPTLAIPALAEIGAIDDAFALAQRLIHAPINTSETLFMPATATLRQDKRFMALAKQLGLVSYWQETGKWPDFCAQPGLPYECRAEASRPAALAQSH